MSGLPAKEFLNSTNILPFRFSVPNSRHAFIGLGTWNQSESFSWIGNTELTYDAWHNNSQSSNGGAKCVGVNNGNQWKPIGCQKRRRALCSKGNNFLQHLKRFRIKL